MSQLSTRKKSHNMLQAQIAAFTAERVPNYRDSVYTFNNIGRLAAGEIVEVVRKTSSDEYYDDTDGKRVSVPEGVDRVVSNPTEYVDYLRSVGGSSHEGIKVRKEMLDTYDELKPAVDKLRGELEDPATRIEHPAYLGNGSNSVVFKLDHDGKQYAVRVPNGRGVKPSVIDSHLAGAVLGKGVPHLEQIVAGSYEDGVTVAEIMPGKEMGNLSIDEVGHISDQQLEDWVDTITMVSQKGIEIDPKESNVFYDPKEGFGFVDYHSSKVASKNTADQNLGKIAGWMAHSVAGAGFYGKRNKRERSVDDYVTDLQQITVNLGVLKRYRVAVDNGLPEFEKQDALTEIDSLIVELQETVDNYSNPDWVADRIAQDAENKRQREERAKQPANTGFDLV